MVPPSADATSGTYLQHQLVRIYLLVGEPEKALDQLEPLLKIPYYLSPGWLKIDPTFAPLRGNLLAGSLSSSAGTAMSSRCRQAACRPRAITLLAPPRCGEASACVKAGRDAISISRRNRSAPSAGLSSGRSTFRATRRPCFSSSAR